MAGIGNIYSDEILFKAGIHPKTRVNQLTKKRLEKVFWTIKEVLNTAIDCRVDPEQFPNSYLIPHRRTDGKCPKCYGKVKQAKVSGRTAYYCPRCQRKDL